MLGNRTVLDMDAEWWWIFKLEWLRVFRVSILLNASEAQWSAFLALNSFRTRFHEENFVI
jgi:hypothetical protein